MRWTIDIPAMLAMPVMPVMPAFVFNSILKKFFHGKVTVVSFGIPEAPAHPFHSLAQDNIVYYSILSPSPRHVQNSGEEDERWVTVYKGKTFCNVTGLCRLLGLKDDV